MAFQNDFRNTVGVWQRTIVDQLGNIVPNPTVEVRGPEGQLSEIYADYDGFLVLSSQLPNPFTAGSDGFVRFYTKDGPCQITVTKGGLTQIYEHVTLGAHTRVDQENIFTVPQFIALATPQLWLYVSDNPVDERYWYFGANSEGLVIGTSNDAATELGSGLILQREANGHVVTTAELRATIQVYLNGPTLVNPALVITNDTLPYWRLLNTGAAADEGLWEAYASVDQFVIRTLNDEGSAASNLLQALRTAENIDTLYIGGDDVIISGDLTVVGNINGSIGTGVIADNSITDEKLRDSAAVSVIGRAANSSGDPADIAAGSNDTILRRVGDVLNFGQFTAGMFPDSICSSLTGTQVTLSATEIELNVTLLDFNGAADFSGAVTINSGLTIARTEGVDSRHINLVSTGGSHFVLFRDSDAAADTTGWLLGQNGVSFQLLSRNDADSATLTTSMSVAHDGSQFNIAATELQFDGTTLDINAAADFSSSITVAGTLSGGTTMQLTSASSPRYAWINSAADADETRWDIIAGTTALAFRALNDVQSASTSWLTATRNLNTITQLTVVATELQFDGTTLDINAAADFSSTIAAVGQISSGGAVTSRPIVVQNATSAFYAAYASSAPSNEKLWLLGADSTGALRIYTRTDADGTGANPLAIDRTGTTVDQITLAATELQFDGTTLDINAAADISGTLSIGGGQAIADSDNIPLLDAAANIFTGQFFVSGAQPLFWLYETGAGADEKRTVFTTAGGNFYLQLWNDAGSMFETVIFVTRTGEHPDSFAITADVVTVNGENVATSDGDTGGSGSAGAGNQYVELNLGGTTYKVLHDGTV